jgi:hypothetical protein
MEPEKRKPGRPRLSKRNKDLKAIWVSQETHQDLKALSIELKMTMIKALSYIVGKMK